MLLTIHQGNCGGDEGGVGRAAIVSSEHMRYSMIILNSVRRVL